MTELTYMVAMAPECEVLPSHQVAFFVALLTFFFLGFLARSFWP